MGNYITLITLLIMIGIVILSLKYYIPLYKKCNMIKADSLHVDNTEKKIYISKLGIIVRVVGILIAAIMIIIGFTIAGKNWRYEYFRIIGIIAGLLHCLVFFILAKFVDAADKYVKS